MNPDALESVKTWIVEQAARSGPVLLATHHLSVCDIQYPVVQRLGVLPNGYGGVVARKIDTDISYVSSSVIGTRMSAGEIYLLTKRWLLVEGSIDQVVLNIWFSDLLAERGVRLIPLRGIGNVGLAAQVDLLAELRKPISVLLDADAPDSYQYDTQSLTEKVRRGYFARDLQASVIIQSNESMFHRELRFGIERHSKVDILMYLDPDCVNEICPNISDSAVTFSHFAGWEVARSLFHVWREEDRGFHGSTSRNRNTASAFKDFLKHQYGLAFDIENVAAIAHLQRERNLIPTELSTLIDRITSPFYGSDLMRASSTE